MTPIDSTKLGEACAPTFEARSSVWKLLKVDGVFLEDFEKCVLMLSIKYLINFKLF
jgi:hypothetical protein